MYASRSPECQAIIAELVPSLPTDLVRLIAEYLPLAGRVFETKRLGGKGWCDKCGQRDFMTKVSLTIPSMLKSSFRFTLCQLCLQRPLEEVMEEGVLMINKRSESGNLLRSGTFCRLAHVCGVGLGVGTDPVLGTTYPMFKQEGTQADYLIMNIAVYFKVDDTIVLKTPRIEHLRPVIFWEHDGMFFGENIYRSDMSYYNLTLTRLSAVEAFKRELEESELMVPRVVQLID